MILNRLARLEGGPEKAGAGDQSCPTSMHAIATQDQAAA